MKTYLADGFCELRVELEEVLALLVDALDLQAVCSVSNTRSGALMRV